MLRRRTAVVVSASLFASVLATAGFAGVGAGAPLPTAEPPLPGAAFAPIGWYSTGEATGTETAAEVVAFEKGLLYVMGVGKIQVVSLANPAAPRLVGILPLPGDPTSVAVDDGLVAVSVPAPVRTDPGRVFFFRENLLAAEVTVGALPDMVTFTPDGKHLLVANEGEPNSYGQPNSVDPEGSVTVIDVKNVRKPGKPKKGDPVPTSVTIGFRDFNVGGPRHAELPPGVRITGPGASVAQDLEPEYITVSDDSKTAYVSLQENNAIAVIDLKRGRVERFIALGTSDHSRPGFGIDPSDRDGGVGNEGRINIANWPVRGLYMPDGIAYLRAKNREYILTANEGDAREYTGYVDVGRAAAVADTTAIPAAGVNAQLGRLNVVTSSEVPKNSSGRVTELFALGSRSFSIRTVRGDLVWDSGDDFEQITARTHPGNFNASNSNNDFDNRSDDKGPEPEAVVVGEIGKRQYAFIALERIGGVMVYDVTRPEAPVFQQYLTTRVFPSRTGGTVGPDSGAEGLLFVAAKDSPNRQPLVIVGNEVTGTVNIFSGVPTDGGGTLTLLHNNDGESTIEPLTSSGVQVAGVAAYKTVLDREIRDARNAGNAVLNVYAGDAFLASSALACSLPPNPSTTPVYDAVAQRQMAYDAHIFGNHEFDFNPDFLQRFVRTFNRNGVPDQPFLSANLDFRGEPTWADLLDRDGVIQVEAAGGRVVARSADLVDETTGMRFGVVGATTPLLPTISSPRNVVLTSTDLQSTAQVVQREIDALTRRGINKIVVVSHLQNIQNDQALVALLRGVDVAVAGGGDELLANATTPLLPGSSAVAGPYPLGVVAADGRTVPVVTTEGNYKYVGRLDVRFDAAGNVIGIDTEKSFPRRVVVSNSNAPAVTFPDRVVPDPGVQSTAVAPVIACLAALAQPIARTEVAINVANPAGGLGFTNGVRTGETNGGNLVTDSYLAAYDAYAAAAGLPPRGPANPVVAVQNGGGIRQNAGNVLPVGATFDSSTGTYGGVPGVISRRNTLDVLAFFTNSMTVLRDMSPAELKLAFERSAATLPSAGGQFLQVAGLTVTYSLGGTPHVVSAPPAGQPYGTVTTPGNRVVSITLADGTPIVAGGAVVPGAPNVTVVTNSFTANGGDNFAAFGGVPSSRRVNLGLLYEQALVAYLLSFPVASGLPTIPASDIRYSNPNGEGRIVVTP